MEHQFNLYVRSGRKAQLWTRDLAKTIRAELLKVLEGAAEGDVVAIDAKGIEVFDYSFANELFGKTLLSLAGEFPGRFLIVENLTDYSAENLGKALESLALLMIHRRGNRIELIGKPHSADEETFRAIVGSRKPVTASELKDRLKLNLTTMNERLSKLANLGVVRRWKSTSPAGREQFEYSVMR